MLLHPFLFSFSMFGCWHCMFVSVVLLFFFVLLHLFIHFQFQQSLSLCFVTLQFYAIANTIFYFYIEINTISFSAFRHLAINACTAILCLLFHLKSIVIFSLISYCVRLLFSLKSSNWIFSQLRKHISSMLVTAIWLLATCNPALMQYHFQLACNLTLTNAPENFDKSFCLFGAIPFLFLTIRSFP